VPGTLLLTWMPPLPLHRLHFGKRGGSLILATGLSAQFLQ